MKCAGEMLPDQPTWRLTAANARLVDWFMNSEQAAGLRAEILRGEMRGWQCPRCGAVNAPWVERFPYSPDQEKPK